MIAFISAASDICVHLLFSHIDCLRILGLRQSWEVLLTSCCKDLYFSFRLISLKNLQRIFLCDAANRRNGILSFLVSLKENTVSLFTKSAVIVFSSTSGTMALWSYHHKKKKTHNTVHGAFRTLASYKENFVQKQQMGD